MTEKSFTEEQKLAIKDAIAEAEKQTSGEIVVHIENKCKVDVLDRAAGVFDMLNMQNTELRNGVLFYLAIKDHKFAILGDAGINQKTGPGFWIEVKEVMQEKFRGEDFTGALTAGIQMAGQKLKEHFPYARDDKNELSDEISFGS
jgi:uncharacterized membrane protein